MSKKQPDVTIKNNGSIESQVHDHDAFGVVVMTMPNGGDKTLFGSDIGHYQAIRIEVHRATLEHGTHDRIYPTSGVQLVAFELSHAQFAQFITSSGKGAGTPITLRYAPARDAAIEVMPGIEKIETKHETHRRNIGEMADKTMQHLSASVEQIEKMLESGKLSKSELKEIHRQLKIAMGNASSNMAYVVESAEEALEKATSDAKIEVESFVAMTAQRIGLSHINELARREDKENDSSVVQEPTTTAKRGFRP